MFAVLDCNVEIIRVSTYAEAKLYATEFVKKKKGILPSYWSGTKTGYNIEGNYIEIKALNKDRDDL